MTKPGDERYVTRWMGACEPTLVFETPLWEIDSGRALVLKGLTVRGTVMMSRRQVELEESLQVEDEGAAMAIHFADWNSWEEPDRDVTCDLYEDELRLALAPPPADDRSFELTRMRLIGALRVRDDVGTHYLEDGPRRGGGTATCFYIGLGRRIPHDARKLLIAMRHVRLGGPITADSVLIDLQSGDVTRL